MDDIRLLSDLVSINSVFPAERRIGEYIEKVLKEQGFTVSRQHISEGRFNVLAERGVRGRPVLFYGHVDTVPAYGEWSSDPFELTEKDGRLHGLGAYDMKAGVAAVLSSMQEETDRRIKVAFGVDEENDSEGAWRIFNSGFLDDVEGIVTGEIGDISDESLGARTVTLGRRGRAVYEFRVPGRSVHGAHSAGEANATSETAKLVIALEEMNEELPSHELLPKASQLVTRVSIEATSLSTPSEGIVVLDRLLVAPENAESVLNYLNGFLGRLYEEGCLREIGGRRVSVSIKKREMPYLMPYVTPQNSGFAESFSEAVRTEAGEPVYNYGWSVADENILASTGIPLVTLPPIGGNEHSADEWVSKNSYLEMIRVMRRFVRSL